jgi:acyl dehydratase
MIKVYGKALAGATVIPVARKVRLMSADGLPSRELTREAVEVDREHLAAYDRVCGFRLRDELPATYPHIVAFPLAMELMTDTSFPFSLMGLVHIANRIDVLRPMTAADPFDIKVWTADLAEHDKGTQFEIKAEARIDGAVVWRSSSTYLHRESKGNGDKREKKPDESSPPSSAGAIWDVPGDIGRRYAAVSGDRNPIHMHPLSAKLFGMKRNIAHGMWTKARCLAALEAELPETYSVDVRFKLPVFLPGKVAFTTEESEGTRRFHVRDARKGQPHVEGQVTA